MADTYKTLSDKSEGIYKEKGSKFLSFAYPVSSEEEVKDIRTRLKKKHHDARHHCYAFAIGTDEPITRINDDGEPSNTAGKPILGQINSFELNNVVVFVIRYFGGILLGTGGLIRAYKNAAEDALKNARITTVTVRDIYQINFDYAKMKEIMILINREGLDQFDQQFETNCSLKIRIKKSDTEHIINQIKKLNGIEYKYLYTI